VVFSANNSGNGWAIRDFITNQILEDEYSSARTRANIEAEINANYSVRVSHFSGRTITCTLMVDLSRSDSLRENKIASRLQKRCRLPCPYSANWLSCPDKTYCQGKEADPWNLLVHSSTCYSILQSPLRPRPF